MSAGGSVAVRRPGYESSSVIGTPVAGMSRAGMATDTASLAEATAARTAVALIFATVLWARDDRRERSPSAGRRPRHDFRRYSGTRESSGC